MSDWMRDGFRNFSVILIYFVRPAEPHGLRQMKKSQALLQALAFLMVSSFLLASLPSPALAQSVNPQSLYTAAWKTIKDAYYDRSFGGQDWSRWQHKYDNQLKTEEDAHRAIRTMLSSLGDTNSKFISRYEMAEEKSELASKVSGIGVNISANAEGKAAILATVEGSPAFKAGIMPGDIISSVDGLSVEGLSIPQMSRHIRGPEGTKVLLGVTRNGEPMEFPLTRASIPIKAIATETVLPGNIGYLRLSDFAGKSVPDDFKSALARMRNTDGLIIDLRFTSAGLFKNATDVASMLLGPGQTIVALDAQGKRMPYKSTMPVALSRQPLVVLTNGATSSMSEVLAGALQDNGRAKLVGERTSGSGLMQSLRTLPDGSGLIVSVMRYLTPKNRVVERLGLQPDYTVTITDSEFLSGKGPWWIPVDKSLRVRTPADGKDVQLRKAIWLLRNEIAFSRGLPPFPDPDEQIASTGTAPTSTAGTQSFNVQSSDSKSKNRPVRDKWALIIGISQFQKPSLNLKYPAKDAQDFANFLINDCHFAADHVKVLTNAKATRSAIMTELGDTWLPRVVKPDDLVMLYFSTHGSPSDLDVGEVNYLVAWDTDPDRLFATGLPMRDLVRMIKGRIRSDRVVVALDACYSGNVDPTAKGIHRGTNVDAAELAQGTGQLVISSSAPNQISWESTKQPNSVFTRHLIQALKIKGDTTKLSEAFQVLKERVEDEVQSERGQKQTPTLKSAWEGADLMLAAPSTLSQR